MRSAWATLKAYPGRFLAVLTAIAIGVGFAAATQMFTASFQTDLASSIGAAAGKVDVIVYPLTDALTATDPRLSSLPGVASVEPIYSAGVQFSSATARGWFGVETIPTDPALRWFDLASGTLPTGIDSVAVDPDTAKRNGLSLGSTMSLVDQDGTDHTVTVVGIIDVHRSALAGASDELFADPALAATLAGGQLGEWDVTASAETQPETLAAAIQTAFGADVTTMTGAQVVAQQVDLVVGEAEVLRTVLLTFAAIAGLVASFVIANTFTILLTQRRRQIGLLRCVGATGAQVRRSVLAEALLVGVIGALGGIVLGVGVAFAAMSLADVAASSFTFDPVAIALTFAVGVIVTMLAALAPAARAMRVTPLAALNAVPTTAEEQRSGRIRLILGGLLLIGGGAGLAAGVVVPSLAIAVGGGAVSAAGVLLLLRSVLPIVLRGLGRLAGRSGATGRLAAANAERNPGRSAATSAALVIAVGLIVTLQVAAASARSSLNESLAQRYPLDVSVTGSPTASDSGVFTLPTLPTGLVGQFDGIDGVTAMELDGTLATVTLAGQPMTMTVLGAPTDVDAVIRSEPPTAGSVALPGWMLRGYRVAEGDRLTFVSGTGSVTVTVARSALAEGQEMVAVISAADLATLDPAAAPIAIWGRLADIDRANDVISDLKPLLAPYATLTLSGAAADHASVEDGLDQILLLVTALLAVAAVIAVVGIGNTLGLSVVERTRESALLRALGLRRSQLRLMLGLEAALLAAVGAVVGILVGVGYGWIGAAATFRQAGEPVSLALPVGQLATVLVLALVAGVAASVLPGRRAAMAAPTDALAEV